MMKQYLGHVLASSLLLIGAVEVYAADTAADTTKVKIQRSFVNLGFNSPTLSGSYQQLSEAAVDSWLTTHKNPKLIEMWRGKGPDGSATTAWGTANTNNQYAELNAEDASALYQSVCLIKGEDFEWNFRHAARSSNTEEATFYIGKVNADRLGFNALQTIGAQRSTQLWTWVDANPTKAKATVSVNSGVYDFIFAATKYSSATLGNFIDDISLKLRPAVEFSAGSGSFYEGGDGAAGQSHSVSFNIVGQILSQSDMPTLQFKVEYPSGYTQAKAVYGTNYRLYKRTASGLVELTAADDSLSISNSNKITFNYTPAYSSSLDYTKGVQVNDLVIKIFGNTKTNGDITLPFAFALDANSKAVAASLSACGNAIVDITFDLKIQEDDIDLSVVKSLTPESVVLKDNLVSYTLDIANNTNVQADGVVLRDNFKNLLRVSTGTLANQTALACEDLTSGTSKACPTTWTDANALTSLFTSTAGSGLSLGNIPANAKYRFTVKNLKVTDTDTDTANAGYAVNTAVIETTQMNDVDPSNNTSAVKTMVAAKTDLSNNKAGAAVAETGVGMFNIAQEGRTGATPLLTQKVDSSGKAYFPLNIQNYGNLAQDYQLYASSTAIAPTVSSGDYSSLVKSGITPFTSGLKVEFYKADIGQCKAGIISQQITQLNVAANATGQVCAVVTAYSSAAAKTNIWFAIESLQSGLGDIILDAVIPQPKQRLLELTNDQSAQVAVGGTYVFLHRITNYGIEDEKVSKLSLALPNDGFLYSLFLDKNKSDALDTGDTLLVTGTEAELTSFIIQPNQSMTLLIKVEAPATAANGMSSQVKLIAAPNNAGKEIQLADLSNTDLISVSPNQLQILKSQLSVASCSMANAQAVISAAYTVQNASLKPNQCLIYKIMVKNSGSAALSNVTINDMYPAYTKQWAPAANILPIIGSNGQNITDSINNKIEDDGTSKIRAILKELLPQQEKSLYFGIKMK